ncbi:MAG: cbb3-type cytochrome oxidase assembly protein CcoS [Planctomycetota bacterium]
MSVIFIVLPLALVFGGAALAAFLWSVRSGQFEDLDTPGIRVALDDDRAVRRRG